MPFVGEGRRIGRVKAILFSLIPTLVLFGGAEVGLRLYVNHRAEGRRGKALPLPVQRNQYQREDPVLGYSLTPGYDAGGIRVNQLGFRGREISESKPPGTFRIVAIGDSTTFGLAGAGCTYPSQLESLLGAEHEGPTFEVVNAGVEGYGSIHALRLLERRIARLSPDLVLVYIGWNDLYSTDVFEANVPALHETAPGFRGDGPGSSWKQRVGSALGRLYLVQWLRRVLYVELPRVKAREQTDDTSVPEIHPQMAERYRWRLEQMVAVIRRMGAQPVLMTLPTVLSEDVTEEALSVVHYPAWAGSDPRLVLKVVRAFNEVIRSVATETGAALVDNAAYFDGLGSRAKEALFFDTLHMVCEGNGLLAGNVLGELETRHLLPRH